MAGATTAVVFTISDSRSAGQATDASGPLAANILDAAGFAVVEQRVIPDEADQITAAVRERCGEVALVVTTGGTGVGPRDVTPEAIRPLLDRELPGFGEIMRTGSYSKTPLSIISRGGAGLVGSTLIIMLPGSPKGVQDGLELLLPAIRHVMKVLSHERVDCAADAANLPQ